MKQKLLFAAALGATVAAVSACAQISKALFERVEGSGDAVSQTRQAAPFHSIHLDGGADVIITAGGDGLRVETEENILPYVVTEIDDGVLHITTKSGISITTHTGIKVYASMKELRSVAIGGSGRVSSDGIVPGGKLALSITGSGDIAMPVDRDEIESVITGSGTIELRGKTTRHIVEISGNGDVKSLGMTAETASVEITGSGSAEVNASTALDVEISGSGNVNHKGTPQVKSSITGSGRITRRE